MLKVETCVFCGILAPLTLSRKRVTDLFGDPRNLLIYKVLRVCRRRESNPQPSRPGLDLKSLASLYFTKPLSFQEASNERAQILLDVGATSGDGEFDQTLFVDDNVGWVG